MRHHAQPNPDIETVDNDMAETDGASAQEEAVSDPAIKGPATLDSGWGTGGGTNGLGAASSGPGAGTGTTRATPLGYGENPPMPYPRTARRRGWQGEVLLRVHVSAGGSVLAVHLEKSSGYAILDDTALRTVAGWRFRPARLGGMPRPDTVIVPIRFKLQPP